MIGCKECIVIDGGKNMVDEKMLVVCFWCMSSKSFFFFVMRNLYFEDVSRDGKREKSERELLID
jgi:hypothetical protein